MRKICGRCKAERPFWIRRKGARFPPCPSCEWKVTRKMVDYARAKEVVAP